MVPAEIKKGKMNYKDETEREFRSNPRVGKSKRKKRFGLAGFTSKYDDSSHSI